MRKGRKLIAVSVFLVFILILQACGDSASNEESSSAQNDEAESNETDDNEAESNEATNYPDRTIEIAVGYGEGGGTDNFARLVGQKMGERLGADVNVINKPGSRAVIAEEYVQSQPADGYTIWAITPDLLVNIASDSTEYGLDEYTPLGRGQADTYSFQTSADSQFDDIDTLIEYAKENPGEVTIGASGKGGLDELSAMSAAEALGIELSYVPYDDAGTMHSDVLGGHTDLMLEEIAPAISTIESGDINVLALFIDKEEVEGFEDVPTSGSRGWDFTDGNTRSFYVKSDTPDEIIEKLTEVYEEVLLEDEEYLQYEKDNYLHLREGYLSSEEFTELNKKQIEHYREILNEE